MGMYEVTVYMSRGSRYKIGSPQVKKKIVEAHQLSQLEMVAKGTEAYLEGDHYAFDINNSELAWRLVSNLKKLRGFRIELSDLTQQYPR